MRTRIAFVLAGCLLAAGCSGVPHSSRPSAIASVSADVPQGGQIAAPEADASERAIVQAFLNANDAPNPSSNGLGTLYLVDPALHRWDPTTVTVVDNENVGTPTAGNKIEVTGTEVGTIDRNGVFTPTLSGDGSGNGGLPFVAIYGLQQLPGRRASGQAANPQWRISSISPNGLLVSANQFQQNFRPYSVYFFDSVEQRLVPDPRWSPQLDPADLVTFLLQRLLAGPRPGLNSDETSEFPTQTDPTSVSATIVKNGDSSLTKIEIPQSSQLGPALNLLAAQLALTLSQASAAIGQMEITDGGKPVRIPSAGSAVFTADEVTVPYLVSAAPPALYYVRGQGRVIDGRTETPVAGQIGQGAYGLDSVAVANRGSRVLVAGTRADGHALDIGSLDRDGEMTAVKLPAVPGSPVLSRPDWAPGLNEAWVADGPKLFAVQTNGKVSAINLVAPSGITTPNIKAVRLSPEGARVALVLANSDNNSQIWIGSISRASKTQIRVDNLTPISPPGVDVADVAWNDELKLFAVGRNVSSGAPNVYEVQADGSLWTADGLANLPEPPETIAAAPGNVAAVESGGSVFTQTGLSWTSLPGAGSAPIYSN